MPQFNTPLRYPGGKGRLTQFVIDVLKRNKLVGAHYLEPYAGGAAIAVNLLQLEYVSDIHINDLNRSVHAFWSAVLNDHERLCDRISRTRVSMAEWHRQRAVQQAQNPDTLDLAFSTFFLNRTNRSGIIGGGVIGGHGQAGQWKINARYTKKDLILRIEAIAELEHRIHLYNLDAATLIRDVLPKLPTRTFVFLDPPYYVKGKGLYLNHYAHEDHEVIARLMAAVKQPWIVTYDNVGPIRNMYAEYPQKQFGLKYSAHDRYEGSEVLIRSHRVSLPSTITSSRGMAA
ncbi:MAG: DNA adenine methylase [Acidobacteria bacterium]|nr:DNA adenine methylase [Acidobacteriota bacterium]